MGKTTEIAPNFKVDMQEIFEFLINAEDHLLEFSHQYGMWIYVLLFLIVYSETGLVVMAFLPGDGLLFSAGVIAASGAIDIEWVLILLFIAAVLGNTSNFFIGRYFGDRLLVSRWKLIRQKDLDRTHLFYEKHGGKALVLGRFLPLFRTFVPFVAGIGHMDFHSFNRYNFIGALAWVPPLTLAGYFFGEIPWVQQNFGLIYLALVVVTAIPIVWGAIKLGMSRLPGYKEQPTSGE